MEMRGSIRYVSEESILRILRRVSKIARVAELIVGLVSLVRVRLDKRVRSVLSLEDSLQREFECLLV